MIKMIATMLLLFIVPVSAMAQHQIQNQVMGNGATTTANGSNQLRGTLGQPGVGSATAADFSVNSGFWEQTIELVTSVEDIPTDAIPQEFRLHQNYPNPFNPSTTIRFEVPRQTQVTIKLYDVLGRRVALLLDAEMKPGVHQLQLDASGMASGVYLYRLEAEGISQTLKLMLLK